TLLEGVEEQTELVMARHLGCDQVQGHAVSPPQPAGEIVLAMENYS
ncbi:MAG: EAL domain-containing protein, partial [Nitrospinaceae bacterium]|nr:EAL domain-containing protein [Nitrospinaceae bacterium]